LGFSWRHPAWLAASATVLIFFAGVWLHHERSTRVELAIFGDLTTRGGSTDIASSLGDNNGAAVLRFDRESAYEAWLNASLWRSKAKIWIDEEHSLLRLKHRDPQSGQIIEVTENLPADPAARPAAIRKLVEQLK
jgi:putative SOS response-associated peptidase YedK